MVAYFQNEHLKIEDKSLAAVIDLIIRIKRITISIFSVRICSMKDYETT